eukprot:TRINITY_DN1124_c3_g1_i1.p1 TRINITY_DN1124_c3_g1~~TRINITY_DN1124_c3_g1_i1.p1  ORF type:complete len:909 (-),score=176.38 TRINITY_DN1124_c3_g1_i1:243-2969(-)
MTEGGRGHDAASGTRLLGEAEVLPPARVALHQALSSIGPIHPDHSSSSSSSGTTTSGGTIRKEGVAGVDGGFVLRQVLSAGECAALRAAIHALHSHAGQTPGESSTDTSTSLASTPSSTTTTTTTTTDDDVAKPRRDSQHHVPCRVPPATLQGLCRRLRQYFPQRVGPMNDGSIRESGHEISPFLRCYYYRQGDASTPHYDRSYVEYTHGPQQDSGDAGTGTDGTRAAGATRSPGARRGKIEYFSAYTLLFYLNDDFTGGHTTFFHTPPPEALTRSRLTLADPGDRQRLTVTGSVQPSLGDALVFPHGNYPGAHPNVFHEGSVLQQGCKYLLRTDIVFVPSATAHGPKGMAGSDSVAMQALEQEAMQGIESLLQQAVVQVCGERFQHSVGGTLRRLVRAEDGPTSRGAEYSCDIAIKLYHTLCQQQQQGGGGQGTGEAGNKGTQGGKSKVKKSKEERKRERKLKRKNHGAPLVPTEPSLVPVTSDYGITRHMDATGIAQAIIDAVPSQGLEKTISYISLSTGPNPLIHLTSTLYAQRLRRQGYVPCAQCPRWVRAEGSGIEWHMKSAHQVQHHQEAYEASVRSHNAVSIYQPSPVLSALLGADGAGQGGAGDARLDPEDMKRAQTNPAVLQRMIAAGKVKALHPGLEACRGGDLSALRQQIEMYGWDPRHPLASDRHGSNALLWAAGGGHVDCVRYLVQELHMPVWQAQQHRRGYDGRTALHWAARNGHVEVARYLLTLKPTGADNNDNDNDDDVDMDIVDVPSTDGTTPFHLAIWQNQREMCDLLLSHGANPLHVNSYGCNAAMWAAQGPHTDVDTFIYLQGLGVHFDGINHNGQGCLHKAAQRGKEDVCRWLLEEAGIRDPRHFAANADELSTPSRLALYAGHTRLSEWLAQRERQVHESSTPVGQ